MTLSTHSYMLSLRVGVSNDNERRIGGLAVPYNLVASTKDGLERVAPDNVIPKLKKVQDILRPGIFSFWLDGSCKGEPVGLSPNPNCILPR